MAEVMQSIREAAEIPSLNATRLGVLARRGEHQSPVELTIERSSAHAVNQQTDLPIGPWFDVAAYQRDLWERSILFLDTLRQRADDLEWLHPMRISRYMFGSSFCPAMRVVVAAAAAIRDARHEVPERAPLRMPEQASSDAVRGALIKFRTGRDRALEQIFDFLYGSGSTADSVAQFQDTARGAARPRFPTQ